MKYSKISSVVLAVGLLVTVYSIVLVYHLERGNFGTQRSFASAYQRYSYLWGFGALLCLAGCFGHAMGMDARTAVRKGVTTLGGAVSLFVVLLVIPFVNKEGWTGAAFLIVLFLLCGGGVVLTAVGVIRLIVLRFS